MKNRASSTEQSGTPRPGKRRPWVWILLGIALLLYPIVATTWNNYSLQRQAELYGRQAASIDPPSERDRLLAQARQYNARLDHHALPPVEESPGFSEYMRMLKTPVTGGVMARVTVPSVGTDLPVYHSTRPAVLYSGAGHMFGSSLPVGGAGTNAVITAHTGMVDAAMFDHLPLVKNGDLVVIDTLGQKLYYQVVGRKVVKPDQWQEVSYEQGKDKLTLITCTPYGLNTDRLLVEAHRIPAPVSEPNLQKRVLSWWMILDLLVIALTLMLLAWMRRKKRKQID